MVEVPPASLPSFAKQSLLNEVTVLLNTEFKGIDHSRWKFERNFSLILPLEVQANSKRCMYCLENHEIENLKSIAKIKTSLTACGFDFIREFIHYNLQRTILASNLELFTFCGLWLKVENLVFLSSVIC